VPRAGATVPAWLPANSARVSNLPACCARGPPACAAPCSCHHETCSARSAWPHPHMQAHPRPVDRGSASGRTVLKGGVVHIEDVLGDSEFTLRDAQKLGRFRTVQSPFGGRDGRAPLPSMWNLTHQVQIYKRDQAEADRLAQAVGHRDAFSARRQNAK
jgi:hypothetical protein